MLGALARSWGCPQNQSQGGSERSFVIDGSREITRTDQGVGGTETPLSSASDLGGLATLGISNKNSLSRLHPTGQTQKAFASSPAVTSDC